ncbi:MAG TPA: sigma-70 family RNA polymerase sigma factor, partial [Chloroflexota bacterium]
ARNEETLVCAAQDGDWYAQSELLRRYEPLVRHTVGMLRLPCRCDRDDIAQEARLALVGAIRGWQSRRGPFPAFAEQCVRTKTANALASARARKHQVLSRAASLEWAPAGGSPVALALLDDEDGAARRTEHRPRLVTRLPAQNDPATAVLVREQLAAVCTAVPTLSANERTAMAGALNGKPQRQIATEMGCTVKAVSQSLRRARAKLARVGEW